ncbi:MAG TPA: metal-dependent hydrolase [Acidobacteriota bacterium]
MAKSFSRRKFISAMSASSLSAGIAATIPASGITTHQSADYTSANPDIIDTNVNLFAWPFRRMKYWKTSSLVAKLRQHRITKAWAGNFEALFSKSISEVNARLAEECRVNGEGMLIPFGTVNPAWPDWEEDLRRCHEVYKMPGIRLYPSYQTFDLNHPEFPRLISEATNRGLIIQIVGDMEDSRVHHPLVLTREVSFEPLLDIMKQIPHAKVQLLSWNERVNSELLKKLVLGTNVVLDISWLESTGALGHLIEGNTWSGPETPVPVERLFFGSHAPYFPVEASLIKLFESPLTLEQMKAVMNLNAQRFFKQA